MPSDLDIRPLGGALGAEIHGVDLNTLNDTERDQIAAALVEHQVIFFRDQDLTPDAHVAFARTFGEVEVIPALPSLDDDHPEIVILDDGATPTADVWHTDVTYAPSPPVASILHMVECPPVGGDTMWISLADAYETLSTPMQELLEGLTAIHVNTYAKGSTEHPLVRVHPVSGRKSIYVNRIFTSHIPQLSRPESDNLLPFLYRWCEQPSFSVRFRWQPNSVAMWDNRATLHSVVNDFTERRIVHRVTVLGDNPQGASEPRWAPHEARRRGASEFYGMAYPF